MENIRLESFQQERFQQVLTCWNQSLIYDGIDEERFKQLILLDENFNPDLFLLALNQEKVVGFCYGVRRKIPYLERGLEENRGWIVIMGVLPEYQNQGIGTMLCDEVEKRLKDMGTKEITLCAYSPNYFFPGIDKRYQQAISFFENRNYVYRAESVSMQRSLWDYHMADQYKEKLASLEKDGIHIIRYNDEYMLPLLNYLLENFGAGWKRNALIAMQKKEAEDTILLVVDEQKNILGFCMRKIDGNDARFGPFGVSEHLRSKGIGGVLFEYMMQEMKQKGIYYLYFLWTDGAAQRFYERHDVKVYRTYQLYRKEV
ncbi:GNAT family N-acetyltransferase [Massilimicrobiota sp. SW1139]|jgi:ribosomal protein S18 acetylase RimI-like enzyme|uniref:GNAT family N-acetyltransferase n=1 Tax=Massilimicrobiota sp. SW1139 TaxID=2530043 RepID=UPI0014394D7B|nr:GNAT family N-acetyltransferase [Massilimicrobiota sp. SW1139]NJE45316.1 GNAT family N-acetyltransferase [Massilimicrobiota sp. SW1139]